MLLKPDTFALTVLLALLTALGPLATDMYLPAMTEIQHTPGGTVPMTQLTLSLFKPGFALGQLVYGPFAAMVLALALAALATQPRLGLSAE